MPARHLPRPRRIAAAVALFALLGGLGAGILGRVAASEEAGPTFTLAEARVGDRGRYVVAPVTEGLVEPTRTSLQAVGIAFERLRDEGVRDATGAVALANLVLLNETDVEGDTSQRIVAYRPGTDRVVGAFSLEPIDGQDGAYGADQGGRVLSSQRLFVSQALAPAAMARLAPPCGLVPPFLGAVAAGQQFAMETLCGPSANGGSGVLVVDAAWEDSGLAFARANDGDGSTYWFRSDVPYPVRIDTAFSTMRLEAFTQGWHPVTAQPVTPPAVSVPPLAYAAWDGWATSEAGIRHPFPLSEAVAEARGDPRVQRFLREHPASYLGRAEHRSYSSPDEGEARHTWWLDITDGERTLPIGVHARDRETHGLVAGLGGRERSVEVSVDDAEDGGLYPSRDRLPRDAPTVSSLWATWQAFAGPEFAGRPAGDWGFSVRCGNPCREVTVKHHGGFRSYERRVDHPLPPLRLMPEGPVDVESRSSLVWLQAAGERPAQPWAYEEERLAWHREGNPPAALDGPPAASLEAQTAPWWVLPPAPAAAAVGLGALLAAALYAFWPTLKAAPLALFSRIRGEALLEHPLRAEIVQRIEAEPGIHHRQLARAMGRGKGSVEHHLRKLVAAGLVRRVQGKGYTCYFVGAPSPTSAAVAQAARADLARAILDAVAASPGIRPAEVARRLGASRAAVHYHLDRLRKAGLVGGEAQGGAVCLHLAARLPASHAGREGVKGSAGTG